MFSEHTAPISSEIFYFYDQIYLSTMQLISTIYSEPRDADAASAT